MTGTPATAQAAAPAPPPRMLRVHHDTLYVYDQPVSVAHHVAHLRPRDTACQTVSGWHLHITPEPDPGAPAAAAAPAAAVAPAEPRAHAATGTAAAGAANAIPRTTYEPTPARITDRTSERTSERTVEPSTAPITAPIPEPITEPTTVQASLDAFGNWRHAFSHARVHDRLQVVSTFFAQVAAPPPVDAQASPPWEQVAAQLRYRAGSTMPPASEFALGSPFAPRGEIFARFAGDIFTPQRPLLDAAWALMQHIHTEMRYTPQATHAATEAAEALQGRHGVCQDFAHIAIAALRSLGLAARYVSGYLLTQPPPGQPRLVGADASHAWFDVWCPTHGWVALDPTNNLRAGQDHVVLAWGRDYGDVAPLRGVIHGGGQGSAAPIVGVTVEPVEEGGAARA